MLLHLRAVETVVYGLRAGYGKSFRRAFCIFHGLFVFGVGQHQNPQLHPLKS